MRTRGTRCVIAALLACCSCSFVAVRRPPREPVPAEVPLECTQSRLAPGLDTIGAVGVPIAGLLTWGLCSFTSAMQSWASDPQHPNCGALLWGTVISTAAYTGSAVYGYRATGECRRLVAERRAVESPGARFVPTPRSPVATARP